MLSRGEWCIRTPPESHGMKCANIEWGRVESGNGGCPGGTLVPSIDPTEPILNQEVHIARTGPRSHLFHTGLARNRTMLLQ